MALGFVVARFGLFLRSIALEQGTPATGIAGSEVIGIGVVVAGVLATGVSLRRFLRARTQIEEGGFVAELFGDVFIAVVTVATGLALIVYRTGRRPGRRSRRCTRPRRRSRRRLRGHRSHLRGGPKRSRPGCRQGTRR